MAGRPVPPSLPFIRQKGTASTIQFQPEDLKQHRLFPVVYDNANYYQLQTRYGLLIARKIDERTGALTDDYILFHFDVNSNTWKYPHKTEAQLKQDLQTAYEQSGKEFNDSVFDQDWQKHWIKPKDITEAARKIAGIDQDLLGDDNFFISSPQGLPLPLASPAAALTPQTQTLLKKIRSTNGVIQEEIESLAKQHFANSVDDAHKDAFCRSIITEGVAKNKSILTKLFEDLDFSELGNVFSNIIDIDNHFALILDEKDQVPRAAQLAAREMMKEPFDQARVDAFIRLTTVPNMDRAGLDAIGQKVKAALEERTAQFRSDLRKDFRAFDRDLQPYFTLSERFSKPFNELTLNELKRLKKDLHRSFDASGILLPIYQGPPVKTAFKAEMQALLYTIPNHMSDADFKTAVKNLQDKMTPGATAKRERKYTSRSALQVIRQARRLLDTRNLIDSFTQSYLTGTIISASEYDNLWRNKLRLEQAKINIEKEISTLAHIRLQYLINGDNITVVDEIISDLEKVQEELTKTLELAPVTTDLKNKFTIFTQDDNTKKYQTKEVANIGELLQHPSVKLDPETTAETTINYRKIPKKDEVNGELMIDNTNPEKMRESMRQTIKHFVGNVGAHKNFYLRHDEPQLIAYAVDQLAEAGVSGEKIHWSQHLITKIIPHLSGKAVSAFSDNILRTWPRTWLISLTPAAIDSLEIHAYRAGLNALVSANIIDRSTVKKESIQAISSHPEFKQLPYELMAKINPTLAKQINPEPAPPAKRPRR